MSARPTLLVLAALGGACTPAQTALELPSVEGVSSWLIIISGAQLITRAQVVTPEDAYRIAIPDDATVEALAFARDLGVPIGELSPPADGVPLPEPVAAFTADVGGGAWYTSEPSAVARGLRVPRTDDCPAYTAESELLSNDDDEGMRGMVRLGGGRSAIFLRDLWLIVDRERTRTIAPLVPDVQAATRDPGQAVWVATETALWALAGEDPFTATASKTWDLPPGLITFSMAVPQPGRVYGLTTAGVLYRIDHGGLRVLHRFDAPDGGRRGQVVADGYGVLAAFGEDATLVRVTEEDVVTRLTLPTLSEGAASIARFGEYGIVVGTSGGNLRAERLGFDIVMDGLGNAPSGAAIRALEVIDEHLYFGGTTGLFGELTPKRFICVATVRAASSVRFVANADGQLLIGGRPLRGDATDVQLTRFTPLK